MMNIGELSQLTEVPTKTIRYYEDIGVFPPADRAPNGYRIYEANAVEQLRFIKDAQATGLTLDEITAVVDLRGRGEATCQHVLHLLEHHLAQLDARITTLQKTRRELVAITERASSLDPSDCTDPNRCQTIDPPSGPRSRRPALASQMYDAPKAHDHPH